MDILRDVGYSCKNPQKVLFGALCALLLTTDCTSVDVSSSQFGKFDFTELDEILYDFELSPHPVSEQDVERTSGDNHVTLVSKRGQKYVCSLPTASEKKDSVKGFESSKLPNISALLHPLQKKPCLTKTIGWWTYEYCHGHFIRQYHLEAAKVVGKSLWLGMFQRETEWNQTHLDKVKGMISSVKSNIKNAYAMAYHAVYYTNGTKCDVTGYPRTAIAKLYCGLGLRDKLVEVQERESCNYTLSIETPLLCDHPMFDPLYVNDPQMLTCSPLISQKEYEAYMMQQEILRQEREKQKQEERQQKETAALKTVKQSAEMESGLRNSEQQLLTVLMYKSLSKLLGVNSETLDSGPSRELTEEDESEGELGQDEKSTKIRKKEAHWTRASDKVGRTARDKHPEMDDAERDDAERDDPERDDADRDTEESDREGKTHSKRSSTYRSMIKLRKDEELDEDQESMEVAVTMARLFSRLLNDVEADTDPKRTLPSHAIPKSISDKFRTEGNTRGRMSGFQGEDDQSKRDQAMEEDSKTQQRLPKSSAGDRTDFSSKQTVHQTAGGRGLKEPLLSKKQEYQDAEEETDTQQKRFLRLLSRKKGLDDHKNYQHSEGGEENENKLGEIIGRLDEEALDDFAGELAEEIDDEELGEVLEQLDGEILREVEEEVAEDLQERLKKAGMKGQTEVKVKILPTYKTNMLRDLLSEFDGEEEDEEEDQVDNDGGSSSVTVKTAKRTSADVSDTLAESLSNLMEELFVHGDSAPPSEERKKQQTLESNYEQVWGDSRQKSQSKKSNGLPK